MYHESDMNRPVSDPKCAEIRIVAKDVYTVIKNKESITLKAPIFCGSIVLQRAKLQLYNFHYKFVKPSGSDFPEEHIKTDPEFLQLIMESRKYIKSFYLIYTDTDSIGIYFEMHTNGWVHNDFYNKKRENKRKLIIYV